MITLKTWLEAIDYKISTGSEYAWNCYGPNARFLDTEDGFENPIASIVFDSKNQTIYEATVCDSKRNLAYRLINPLYKNYYLAEAKSRNLNAAEAWEGKDFVELEVDGDILEKTQAILNGETFDERVIINLEIDDDKYVELLKLAHEKDITFNKLIEEALQFWIDSEQNKL